MRLLASKYLHIYDIPMSYQNVHYAMRLGNTLLFLSIVFVLPKLLLLETKSSPSVSSLTIGMVLNHMSNADITVIKMSS